MVREDFDIMFRSPTYDNDSEKDKNDKRIGSEMGMNFNYTKYKIAGIDAYSVSIPLLIISEYRKNLFNTRTKLLIKLPTATYINVNNGAETYQLKSAIGLEIPLYKEFWKISGLVGAGVVGSVDQGAASGLRSYAGTNTFAIRDFHGFGLRFGTMYGKYKTFKIEYNDYESNPDLQNNVLKNSIVLIKETPIFMGDLNVEFIVSNIQYYGDDLYIESENEYGISLVKTGIKKKSNNELRVDLKYSTADSAREDNYSGQTEKAKTYSLDVKFQF
jgi:hypothetical protein